MNKKRIVYSIITGLLMVIASLCGFIPAYISRFYMDEWWGYYALLLSIFATMGLFIAAFAMLMLTVSFGDFKKDEFGLPTNQSA